MTLFSKEKIRVGGGDVIPYLVDRPSEAWRGTAGMARQARRGSSGHGTPRRGSAWQAGPSGWSVATNHPIEVSR